MIIKYEFANGEITEVEVSEELGAVIIDSRRKEESLNRKERRHCYSLDAAVYEGLEYGAYDSDLDMSDDTDESKTHVRKAFSHLSETQKRRLLMLASGLSIREIARREGKDFSSVRESIESARKKFLKFF